MKSFFKILWLLLSIPAKIVIKAINLFGVNLLNWSSKKEFKGIKFLINTFIVGYGLTSAHEGLREDAQWYYWYEGDRIVDLRKEAKDYNCNNIHDVGCDFDITPITYSTQVQYGSNDFEDAQILEFMVVSGNQRKINQSTIPSSWDESKFGEIIFPSHNSLPRNHQEYSIKLNGENVNFTGKLFHIDTGETICKFDGDGFAVIQCEAYWNKNDSLGIIEIVDREERVHFRVLKLSENAIIYHGFFKVNDEYFIFGKEVCSTTSKEKALEYIDSIKPLMIHYKENSLGEMRNI